eukprot:scaffold93462_cov60-Phaeocystis_antarctica.AAC.2
MPRPSSVIVSIGSPRSLCRLIRISLAPASIPLSIRSAIGENGFGWACAFVPRKLGAARMLGTRSMARSRTSSDA